MGERISAREKLLQAAAELFYAEGVGATGIDTITARAGVAKMSLYNNFRSKADLVHAYLSARLEEWHKVLARHMETASTAEARVLAVFDSYVEHAGRAYQWGFRGCGLLNAAAELPVDDPGRAIVASQKAEVENLFRLHLTEIAPDRADEVEATAAHLAFLLEGAMALAGLDGHDTRLKQARLLASNILAQFSAKAKST
ncbi:TetR family transcriptional regulator [Rhizobium sp. Root274]|uniref:TetR/AcrR family transcriptional regulator n=1 Tax=unclassified Rhizobium TaxID=2613769 RepID=UPI000713B9BF|nr:MULTISPECIES: TetR/AcrR family transcriptional regulator [unclassified Rhizobium]KQW28599.1 TetR family transcriptional regulator [Rhizobium sp. Root1240]KRD28800.1 TetR family transcriptional regulator [Rhizobium sp. Root274]